MTKKNTVGFYSFMQYCPNQSAFEVVNVGIILFSFESKYVGVRVTPDNKRISHIFGGGIRKYDTLQECKNGFSELVELEKRRFLTIDGAKKFLHSHIGQVSFSSISSIQCTNGCDAMLDELYSRYFICNNKDSAKAKPAASRSYFPKKRIMERLYSEYGDEIREKIAFLPNLKIAYSQEIKPMLAFKNEHMNVVFPKSFSQKQPIDQLGYGTLLADEIKQSKSKIWQGVYPVILGKIPVPISEQIESIEKYFKRCNIGFYSDEARLIDYILRCAEPLPNIYKTYAEKKDFNYEY